MLFFCRKNVTRTNDNRGKYYRDSAQTISMVEKWFTEIRSHHHQARVNIERFGLPIEAAFFSNNLCLIQKVKHLSTHPRNTLMFVRFQGEKVLEVLFRIKTYLKRMGHISPEAK